MKGKGNSLRSARWLLVVAIALGVAGCKEKKSETAQTAEAPGSAATATVVTQASWSPDAIEELVAPIALFPDPLVGQILAASVNPQEVLDAGNWLLDNKNLKGNDLDVAAEKAGFGPAMRALVQFPDVVDMMCQQLDWTKQLGSAFTSDQKAVLDAIQRLRTSAIHVGNLKSTKQQTVEQTTQQGQPVVIVQPADPKVIYVPQYDPQVVYTQQPPSEQHSENSDGSALAGALVGFGIGMLVGSAMNSYCYPAWGYGAVYYGQRPFYPPAYAYRPVYGAGFHPAYGYNNIHRNTNVNVNINNNYFNRFDSNRNLHGGQTRSPIASTRPANNRNNNLGGQTSRGQSTYKGKNNNLSGQTGNKATPATRNANVDRGYGGSNRPATANTGTRGATNGASAGNRSSTGAARPSASAGAARPSASTGGVGQGAAQQAGAGASPKVGSSPSGGARVTQEHGASVIRSTSGPSGSSGSGGHDNAFSGGAGAGAGAGDGAFERSASARGRSSASSSGGSSRSSGSRGGGARMGGRR
jgi:hypothetical protein